MITYIYIYIYIRIATAPNIVSTEDPQRE